MNESRPLTKTFLDLQLKWLVPSSLTVFVGIMLLNSQKMVLRLNKPLILFFIFSIFFVAICKLAEFITDKFLIIFKIRYPTVFLWFYPTISLFIITLISWLFLSASDKYLGRSFWSNWLELTRQDTTSFLFSCFMAMAVFISIQFIFSIYYVFQWIIETSRQHLQDLHLLPVTFDKNQKELLGEKLILIRSEIEKVKNSRLQATKVNRIALFSIFIIAVITIGWIVWFNPALILYYRAEIQLRTFLEPMIAFNTLKHLKQKYPNFNYLDSVDYKMAWILDRRLKDFEMARNKYETFLKNFGNKNAWSVEAFSSLVRINMDKINNPEKAIFWANKYLKNAPLGIMAPHMYLYKARAFNRLKQPEKAKSEIQTAKKLFSHKKIQMINSEDRLIGLVDFSEVLQTEVNITEALNSSNINEELK